MSRSSKLPDPSKKWATGIGDVENLHEYKLYRKQPAYCRNAITRGGACAYDEAPGAGWLSCPKVGGQKLDIQDPINKLEPISGISVRFQTPRLSVDLTSIVAAIS